MPSSVLPAQTIMTKTGPDGSVSREVVVSRATTPTDEGSDGDSVCSTVSTCQGDIYASHFAHYTEDMDRRTIEFIQTNIKYCGSSTAALDTSLAMNVSVAAFTV